MECGTTTQLSDGYNKKPQQLGAVAYAYNPSTQTEGSQAQVQHGQL